MDLVRRNAKRSGNVKYSEVDESLAWHLAPSKCSGEYRIIIVRTGVVFLMPLVSTRQD